MNAPRPTGTASATEGLVSPIAVSPIAVSPIAVSPVPTDEELAAIFAALELAWPRPVIAAAAAPVRQGGSWKWSGRWWAQARR